MVASIAGAHVHFPNSRFARGTTIMRRAHLLLAFSLVFVTGPLRAEGPSVVVVDSSKAIEVRGVSDAEVKALSPLSADADVWSKVLLVCIDKPERERVAMFGSYRAADGAVRFTPRFPLTPGVTYRVVFDPAKIPGHSGGKPIDTVVMLPRPAPNPTTTVVQIYPTADRLPENQLRFYIYFSAPMERGDSYRRMQLLDERGKAVVSPFLEMEPELWDPEGKRFTLYFDPGRIKRGLKPREDLGPVLEEGKRYTLVIDRAWEDAEGNRLKESFRKSFSVGPPEEKQLDVKTWMLTPPDAGSTTPLAVASPIPLDHALFHRLVWVEDAGGRKVAGTVAIDEQEKRWRFTPKEAWQAGTYRLVANTLLEDITGNSIARPFEVDVFRPVQREIKSETVAIPFTVKGR
jgi:hypothetical protein